MKRWVSVAEYSELTGMKVSSIKNLARKGTLTATKTDGGGKWMIMIDEKEHSKEDKLDQVDRKLDALCKHLGINIPN